MLLLTTVVVEYGGWFMLRVARGDQPATDLQTTCFVPGTRMLASW